MNHTTTSYELQGVGKVCFVTDTYATDKFSIRLRESYKPIGPEALCIALSNAGGTCIDLGANLGSVTLPMAVKGMRVLAVEALPSNCQLLSAAVNATGVEDRVTVAHAAASDKAETVWLKGTSAYGTVVESGGDVQVRADTVSALAQEYGFVNPDLIKMDIEGLELRALLGSASMFSGDSAPDMVFEANGAHCVANNYMPSDLVEFFEIRRYSLFAIYGKELYPRTSRVFQEFGLIDYYATRHPERVTALQGYKICDERSEDAMIADLVRWLDSPNLGYRRFMSMELKRVRPSLLRHAQVQSALQKLVNDPDAQLGKDAFELLQT